MKNDGKKYKTEKHSRIKEIENYFLPISAVT